jgi:hypothetical protein
VPTTTTTKTTTSTITTTTPPPLGQHLSFTTVPGTLDGIADLPGPGSISLPGNAQFVASPSGAFLTE